ncbi:hypothetical protein B0H10DRAFT_2209047 [Mycena sp. CBHHK59/15]|nr:hypothetical protein B0H10DRAFT_2209047 [Mycena sp. CBHHK59/15]
MTALKAKWTSGVYQFFKADVKMLTDDDSCKFQQFECNAPGGCKKKLGLKGVHRFQTTLTGDPYSDRSSTLNLKKHAESCWGKDVVKVCLKGGTDAPRNGNIFSAFACIGQRPVKVTHCLMRDSAHLVHWIAEANRAVKIVEDRKLKELLGAGRLEFKMLSLPVPFGCR